MAVPRKPLESNLNGADLTSSDEDSEGGALGAGSDREAQRRHRHQEIHIRACILCVNLVYAPVILEISHR